MFAAPNVVVELVLGAPKVAAPPDEFESKPNGAFDVAVGAVPKVLLAEDSADMPKVGDGLLDTVVEPNGEGAASPVVAPGCEEPKLKAGVADSVVVCEPNANGAAFVASVLLVAPKLGAGADSLVLAPKVAAPNAGCDEAASVGVVVGAANPNEAEALVVGSLDAPNAPVVVADWLPNEDAPNETGAVSAAGCDGAPNVAAVAELDAPKLNGAALVSADPKLGVADSLFAGCAGSEEAPKPNGVLEEVVEAPKETVESPPNVLFTLSLALLSVEGAPNENGVAESLALLPASLSAVVGEVEVGAVGEGFEAPNEKAEGAEESKPNVAELLLVDDEPKDDSTGAKVDPKEGADCFGGEAGFALALAVEAEVEVEPNPNDGAGSDFRSFFAALLLLSLPSSLWASPDDEGPFIGDPNWIGFGFSAGRVPENLPFLAEAVRGRVDGATSTDGTCAEEARLRRGDSNSSNSAGWLVRTFLDDETKNKQTET